MISEFILKKDAIAPNAIIIHPITIIKKPSNKLLLKKSQDAKLLSGTKLFREPTIRKTPTTTITIPIIPYRSVHPIQAKAPLQALPQVTIELASVRYFYCKQF